MGIHPAVLTEYNIDLSEELSIEDFLPSGFYKVATAQLKADKRFIKNPDVNPIDYIPVREYEKSYTEYKELIYILVIDGKVAKIGGSKTGLKKRHESYNCGTRKARNIGTCSVTNYNITETQYAAIMSGKTVDWYMFDVPTVEVEVDVFGKKEMVKASVFTKYEASLLAQYSSITGHFPILSKNSGVD